MYRKFITLIVSSIIIITVILIGLSFVKFKVSLSPGEMGILHFSYEKVKIAERQPLMATALRSPIDVTSPSKEGYPDVLLSEIAPAAKAEEQNVSFILIKGGKKIAIINNVVVREGDSINLGKVAKIEKGGVLIKNKEGEQWLKIN